MYRVANFSPLIFTFIVLLTIAENPAKPAKILFFLGIGSSSHRVAMQPLATRLSEIGHQITFLSHTKPTIPNPNITEFFPESVNKILSAAVSDVTKKGIEGRLKQKYFDYFLTPDFTWEFAMTGQAATVRSPEFKEWIQTTAAKFDLIIYDSPIREVALGIAYKMGAKVIAYNTFATNLMGNFDFFGLPLESSWHPDWTIGSEYFFIPDHFVFTYNALRWYFSAKWTYFPQVDALLEELYGEDLPPTEELMRRIDLIFINEHFSSGFPISLPPYVIQVGGAFCENSAGVLPQEMEAFLQTKEKFVFFTFGSALKFSALPAQTQQMLFQSMESMNKTNFLLKWDGEIPKTLPKNVYALNWFPQKDVLAHPKCRGFVTQGGVMSYQQAVYNGVPMLIIPIFADQNYVGHSASFRGIGMMLELSEISTHSFTEAVGEILDNQKYYNNAEILSQRFKDRPMSPLDTAVWWTEYVLRHDTTHLKSLIGINQDWWQRRLLDFWATVLIFLSCVCYATWKVGRQLLKLIFRQSNETMKTA